MDGPELSAVIADLRASLQKAKEEGDGKDLRFSVEDVEVEFQVAVTREAGGKFGLKVYVFDAHADAKQSQAVTQKVKLNMKVVDARPEDTPGHGLVGAEGAKAKPPRRP